MDYLFEGELYFPNFDLISSIQHILLVGVDDSPQLLIFRIAAYADIIALDSEVKDWHGGVGESVRVLYLLLGVIDQVGWRDYFLLDGLAVLCLVIEEFQRLCLPGSYAQEEFRLIFSRRLVAAHCPLCLEIIIIIAVIYVSYYIRNICIHYSN